MSQGDAEREASGGLFHMCVVLFYQQSLVCFSTMRCDVHRRVGANIRIRLNQEQNQSRFIHWDWLKVGGTIAALTQSCEGFKGIMKQATALS